MRKQAPAQDLALDTVNDMSHRALEATHSGLDSLRSQAVRAGDQTVDYIRDEPVKSVLAAVALGAVAALLLGWLGRSHIR